MNWKYGKPNGLWKEYYESGKLETVMNWKDGLKSGLLTCYHENGQLKLKGNYVFGAAIGTWKYYDKKGKLRHIEEEGEIEEDYLRYIEKILSESNGKLEETKD